MHLYLIEEVCSSVVVRDTVLTEILICIWPWKLLDQFAL